MRASGTVRRRGLWCVVALALSSANLVAPASPGAQARKSEEFTFAERRALSAGKLVTRPVEAKRDGLELIGGSSWQVIDAPPEVVFRALLDTQYYPRMLPQVREARLIQHRQSARTVFLRQGSGPIDMSYYITLKPDQGRQDIRFELDRSKPHGLRAAWGFYSVRPYRGGRSLLAYGVMADLGPGMLRVLVRDTVHTWMLRVPWMVKRFVEGSGRWIYHYEPPAQPKGTETPGVASSASALR